jgi:hypothetical protein
MVGHTSQDLMSDMHMHPRHLQVPLPTRWDAHNVALPPCYEVWNGGALQPGHDEQYAYAFLPPAKSIINRHNFLCCCSIVKSRIVGRGNKDIELTPYNSSPAAYTNAKRCNMALSVSHDFAKSGKEWMHRPKRWRLSSPGWSGLSEATWSEASISVTL